MPSNSFKNATQPRNISGLIQLSPSALTPPVGMSADPEFNSLAIAPIPTVLGTVADAARQFYRSSVSQLRMSPLPTQASAAVGAQAQSTVIVTQVSQGGGGSSGSSGINLLVNSMVNPVQNILNITGSGVSYGPGKGQVNISANYQEIEQAGTLKPIEPILNFLAPITVTDNPGNTSSDIAVSVMVGDSGAGGVKGLVPAPAAGSAAAGKFLKADGTFQIPPGTGGAANYQTVQQAGVTKPTEPVLNFLAPFVVTDNPGNTSTDISLDGNSTQTTTVTNSAVAFGSFTNVATLTIAIPATGGTYRIRASYSASCLGSGSLNGIDAWVVDQGSGDTWAYYDFFQSGNMNGATWNVNASDISPHTYAAGAGTITLLLRMQGNHSGSSWTIESSALVGPGTFKFAAVVEAIN